MNYDLPATFSVYEQATAQQNASMLITYRHAMITFSHEIEAMSMTNDGPWRLFVGFQRFSNFRAQAERYTRLAHQHGHIYVFGVADEIMPAVDNITFVPLSDDDQLAKEWFLIAYGDQYQTTLVCENYHHAQTGEEVFRGLWSFEAALAKDLQTQFSTILGLPQLSAPPLPRQKQVVRMQNTLERLLNASEDRYIKSAMAQRFQNGYHDLTMLVSRIRNFDDMSSGMTSGDTMTKIVTPYFDAFSVAGHAHGGFVDKVVSSEIIMVFENPTKAVVAAHQAQQLMREIRPDAEISIGIAHGRTYLFQPPGTVVPTALGSTVNLARHLAATSAPGIWVNNLAYADLVVSSDYRFVPDEDQQVYQIALQA